MFHFPSFASGTYGFSAGSRGFAAGGFPIRKSPGQSLLGGSPELIAACHVLHRLLTPGHPPCALIRLITTQRMKNIRTHSQDRLSKNPGRDIARDPIKTIPETLRSMSSASLAPVGGGERDRTDDLLVANQALSQLSYTPRKKTVSLRPRVVPTALRCPRPTRIHVVGLGRIELPTSRLSGVRSNHLSYRPEIPDRSKLNREGGAIGNPCICPAPKRGGICTP
jgi:hypothetical protein